MAITPAKPAPAVPATPADPAAPAAKASPSGMIEQLKVIGGLLALVAGLLTLVGVLLIADKAGVTMDQFTQLATTVIGVVGSVVGAYFGVKIGTDGTDKALEAQRQEAARAQIFAAHLPPALAGQALQLAFPGAAGAVPVQDPPQGDGAPVTDPAQTDSARADPADPPPATP